MEKLGRRALLVAAGSAGVAVGLAAEASGLLGSDDTRADHTRVFQKIPPRELLRRVHFPNVELVTQEGKKVHFYDDVVKDRRVVIQFMFTRCDKTCPVVTDHLVKAQKILGDRVGRDIFFNSVTLSPEEDSPKQLRAYARQHRADWTFLTGKPADILQLRRALGFTYNNPKEDADRNNHSGMLLVGDEPLTRWAHCEGGARPEWIATVIRTEADAPFMGSVNGDRLNDPAIHVR